MNKFIKDKIRVTWQNLIQLAEKEILTIDNFKFIQSDYKKGNEIPEVNEAWKDFGRNDRIKGIDTHYWFSTKLHTPKVNDDEELFFELKTGHEGEWDATNPQGLLYLNGEIAQGLDVNHTRVKLEPDMDYDVLIYFYAGMIDHYVEVNANIKSVNKTIRQLYYDLKVPYDATDLYEEDDYNRILTLKYLEQTCNRINFRDTESQEFYDSIIEADKFIREEFYGKVCGNNNAIVSYVGHTHIDVAWLWTLAQTREKVQRSFATVLNLMDRYPEYVFMSSQPQLYQYLKEESPELYEKVKEKVKEGRWEVEGAMWLEADCNLSSGESLIRQILHGKKFMKDEFDVDSHILWLPDVFGYSAALPQILKKSGVDKFVTSKISWSESNQMPYDTFMWEGIDGTELFSYFLTAKEHNVDSCTMYIGNTTPTMNLGTWERYQQKEYNNEVIVTFGYGDGGGGPTDEMIENERRLEYGLPGMPKAQMSFAGDFLDRVKSNFDESCKLNGKTPRWVGELYLEFHRGTYTSIAKNKKNNRECEFLCQNAEELSVITENLLNEKYPSDVMERSWKTILLNQFHDIIPGSSIVEVYEESDRQYQTIRDEVGEIKDAKLKSIADNVDKKGLLVYNPNSFEASGYVLYNGETIYAESVPPMGWVVLDQNDGFDDGVKVSKDKISSPHYELLFDEYMNIKSIFDKDNNREVIKPNMTANRLVAFEDYPRIYDNWEITNYYKQKKYNIDDVSDVKIIEGNGYGGVEITRKYLHSTIKQTIKLYSKNRRIDVENEIDWHEHHEIVKAMFPVDIHANKATYEIQMGNVERPTHENTSWDAAKFEVCAHKWADISEEGYGVSLINNCKYGHSTLGSEMTLTLIKCGTYPNEQADQGIHTFTYSIYPHKDDYRRGETIKEAYMLNRGFEVCQANGGGKLPSKYSFVNCDSENIIIETVKQAENGNGIIVRMYDAWDKRTVAKLKFGINAKKISVCDLMENPIQDIGAGDSVSVNVNNFEIVTLLIEV